jgi:methyl-accepting chemotaxis protein
MRDSLAPIVAEVRNGTDTINSAATEIAAGNDDLSLRTEQQAGSLEETAASMEELTATVRQNAANADAANTLALSASSIAQKGNAVVSKVVSTMGNIDQSAKKIADIISVIDSIAFQTNILALNAAVEAARAGEQGRGFAVVATEVRNLAHRSATAAKEIKVLINDSVNDVEIGSKLVSEAGVTMEEVFASVRQVNEIMTEISAASREQSAGIEQVNQAITEMDQVMQQNAMLAEEATVASRSMQDQATALQELVAVFQLDTVRTIALSKSTLKPRLVLATKAPASRRTV